MSYFKVGNEICCKINNELKINKLKAAFVTGGGYAYRSIKYKKNANIGDYDFMIIYKNVEDINCIRNLISKIGVEIANDYAEIDMQYLMNGEIDIIRITGTYKNFKITFNLVPLNLIEYICKFKDNKLIRKIAHGRNTGFFYAYGSNKNRIIVNMFCREIYLNDDKLHYIHLDTTPFIINDNLYLGILSDAILKGHEKNFDSINFKELRTRFISNIKYFLLNNKKSVSNYIKMFSNNEYFDNKVKQKLKEEFNKAEVKEVNYKNLNIDNENIMFLQEQNYKLSNEIFDFRNQLQEKCSLKEYIVLKQNNEYDRQYLVDMMSKFFSYISPFIKKEKVRDGFKFKEILDNAKIYGNNELEVKEFENNCNYESLLNLIYSIYISDYINKDTKYVLTYMIVEFLKRIEFNQFELLINKCKELNDSGKLITYCIKKTFGMLNKILQSKNFDDLANTHNFYSNVFSSYTDEEIKLLKSNFSKDEKILDIMCGYGRISNRLVLEGYKNIYGLDRNKYNLNDYNFNFIQKDVNKFNPKEKFDGCFCLYNCFDNVKHLEKLYSLIKKVLKPKGKFIVDVFNADWRSKVGTQKYIVYQDEEYTLEIVREYNIDTKEEITTYYLHRNEKMLKCYKFSQSFFSLEEVQKIFSNATILNSENLSTRNNAQKFIVIGEM